VQSNQEVRAKIFMLLKLGGGGEWNLNLKFENFKILNFINSLP